MSKLTVSVAPHIRDNSTTQKIMLDVLIAMLPAAAAGVWIFGIRAAVVMLTCVVACVASEALFEIAVKRPVTVLDLSAAVTGLLLAFNLPSSIPLWMAVVGSVFAIVVVKQLFGGIGKNFANPAITARVMMLIAFSGEMTKWLVPGSKLSTAATPMAKLAAGQTPSQDLMKMLLGQHGGSLGETCSIALLIGFGYLLVRKVITWHTPVAYVGTVFVLTAVLGAQPVYQVLGGGLLLGAIFMATDYVTTPPTSLGRLIFGIGAGLITVLIRVYGNYPEGVSYAILLMNILTPHISKLTANKPFGGVKHE